MSRLHVHFLPELVDPAALAGMRVAVIDVLRATTTMVQALAAGASAVRPCLTIEDARGAAESIHPGTALLGGERGGLPIAGFDLGNSPAEYTPDRVAGKTVVLTTTNGTKAFLHCLQASEIVVAALVNVSAVAAALDADLDAAIVCAGTDGQITREDVLCAGAIVARLAERSRWQLNDSAAIAADAWRSVPSGGLVSALRASRGGANLVEIGLGDDIALAANVDQFDFAPRYDAASGVVRR